MVLPDKALCLISELRKNKRNLILRLVEQENGLHKYLSTENVQRDEVELI